MDMQHGLQFLKRAPHLVASTDYAVTADSDLCIITAGVRQREGESRRALVQRNVAIFKSIVPQLVRHSPNAILLVVSNPVDVLTYVTWKISGLPTHRVFGSGTNLDSGRFRFLLSERFNVSPSSMHAMIIGEHGDASVPVWSTANIAGTPLRNVQAPEGEPKDTAAQFNEIASNVVNAAYEIIRLKGYTSWAIGLSVCELAEAIMHDLRRVVPVSVNAKGFPGITEDVYCSLPAVLDLGGVARVLDIRLSDSERTALLAGVQQLLDLQKSLVL